VPSVAGIRLHVIAASSQALSWQAFAPGHTFGVTPMHVPDMQVPLIGAEQNFPSSHWVMSGIGVVVHMPLWQEGFWQGAPVQSVSTTQAGGAPPPLALTGAGLLMSEQLTTSALVHTKAPSKARVRI
jgi:hypothetical protein